MEEAFDRFWRQHPALLYAISAVIGFYSTAFSSLWLVIPFVCVWWPLVQASCRTRLLHALIIMGAMCCYGKAAYRFPCLPPQGIAGSVHFTISSLSLSQTLFGQQWVYQGKAKIFIPDKAEEKTYWGLSAPCRVKLGKIRAIQRPPANCSYVIHGTLKELGRGSYRLDVDKKAKWRSVKGSWSLGEWRYHLKTRVKRLIINTMPSRRAAEFLCGMITGDFEDRLMRYEFGKVGLQHLMAISGFHFACLAAFLSSLLRLVMPRKSSVALLVFLLTLYVLVLGCSPSVVRAWIMSVVALSGSVIEKQSISLNSLGIAILMVLFFDPALSLSLGFLFSVITTASIVLWHPIAKTFLENHLIQRRHLEQMMSMSLLDQHCYLLLSLLRSCLSLAIAVNLVALPLALYFFQSFPVLGLVYNAFIPFLVSFCIVLFLLGVAVSVVLPFLGSFLHHINSALTDFILNCIYQLPVTVNYSWYVPSFSIYVLLSYLCIVFTVGIYFHVFLEDQKKERVDLMFV
ncbi:MAG: ComEC/Rec2 family competence protein [Waddliaceae bacterium]